MQKVADSKIKAFRKTVLLTLRRLRILLRGLLTIGAFCKDYEALALSFENEERLFLKTNTTMQVAVVKAKIAMRVISGTVGDGLGEEEECDGKVMLWMLTGVMSGYLSMTVGLTRIRQGVSPMPVLPISVAFGYLVA